MGNPVENSGFDRKLTGGKKKKKKWIRFYCAHDGSRALIFDPLAYADVADGKNWAQNGNGPTPPLRDGIKEVGKQR